MLIELQKIHSGYFTWNGISLVSTSGFENWGVLFFREKPKDYLYSQQGEVLLQHNIVNHME